MEISVEDYARECAEQGLRGDYSACRSDFTVAQSYDYSDEEQEVWRLLCDRQTRLTKRLAHRSYLDGVEALGLIDRIPDFGEVSDKLRKLTGWEIVAVPGLIPAGAVLRPPRQPPLSGHQLAAQSATNSTTSSSPTCSTTSSAMCRC